MPDPSDDETFRPGFGRATAGALMALCVVAAVITIGSGARAVISIWPWIILVGAATWALYWRPKVVVSDHGVRIVNVTRTFDVPWPAIDDIDTTWTLTLHTAVGRIQAWAAPTPSAHRRRERRERRMGHRPSATPTHQTPPAAHVVRDRWVDRRDSGQLADADTADGDLRSEWHWGVIVGGVVLTAAAVGSLLI